MIKYLLIPKLNHFILNLVNQNIEYLKTFENEFYKFLWGRKIPKIKKHYNSRL